MSNSEYTNQEFENNYPDGMQNYYWTYARNMILFNELKKHNLLNKNILEVGCAKGLVVSFLRKKGLNIWGCELGNINVLDDVKDFIFINQDGNDLPQAFRNSIHILMILDVIEHIDEPTHLINNLIRNYPNVQYIYITVPARKELWSSYDVAYRHFRRYNMNQLKNAIHTFPFHILSVQYVFKLLYLPALIVAKTTKTRNHKMIAPVSRKSIFIHRILANILYFDYLIFPKKWYGSSIFLLLKNNNR